MVQMMPLPPVISCFIKIQNGSGAGLPELSWKKGEQMDVVVLSISDYLFLCFSLIGDMSP